MSIEQIRKKYVFHGRVQGVGFRMTTASLAKQYPVCGYVKNMFDGTVEMVVAGSTSDVASLLADIDDAFPGNVTQRDTEDLETLEQFSSFTIRD